MIRMRLIFSSMLPIWAYRMGELYWKLRRASWAILENDGIWAMSSPYLDVSNPVCQCFIGWMEHWEPQTVPATPDRPPSFLPLKSCTPHAGGKLIIAPSWSGEVRYSIDISVSSPAPGVSPYPSTPFPHSFSTSRPLFRIHYSPVYALAF